MTAVVEVTVVDLRRGEAEVAALAGVLTAEEQARAGRLRGEELQRRFVVGRGELRRRLGAALGVAPAAVRLGYGAQGKPHVLEGGKLQFNVAHCEDLALLALAWGQEVGVDVERVRVLDDLALLAARVLTAEERAVVMGAETAEAQAAMFLRYWTCKEALVKATGEGLQREPQSFEVVWEGAGPRVKTVGGPETLGRWRLALLAPRPGFCAAVAAEGEDWKVVMSG